MGRSLARVLAALVVGPLTATPAIAAPPPPGQDPFYRYSGATPLADLAPGTVLASRSIQLAAGTTATPVTAEQLLYRTTGQTGQPTATVTTVITPANGAPVPRIVGYLSFYDGLGARCDPSYALAGGDEGGSDEQQAEEEELQIADFTADGYVVTVPDFEGTALDWTAGREAGYGTLDAVRATESYLQEPATTPVGLTGYSGGAIAGDWASELAATYAPSVNLVGVAEGGIPVDYAHLFAYVDGTDEFSSAIPGFLLGLSRAYHLDLAPYLSSYGAKVVHDEGDACIAATFGQYPGLTVARVLAPPYQDITKDPTLVRILNEQIMGSAPGHPTVPLLMGVGNSDGTGDGVMRADDVEALAHEYCSEGVQVELQTYQGMTHITAGAVFDPQVGPFLAARFAGLPFTDGCGSIGPGDSIAPLPVPVGKRSPGQPPTGRAPRAVHAPSRGGRLAATGGGPLEPLAGGTLIAAAALSTRVRRRRPS